MLLVHALGMSSVNWDRVGVPLARECRVVAMDLPGHGQSSADMIEYYDVFRPLCAVARALDEKPLLVGHDHGGYCMAEAVASEPELFTAGVAIGGSLARTREEMKELCDFAGSDFFAEQLRERFGFGVRGHTEEEARDHVERVVAAGAEDWVTYDVSGLRDELTYGIVYLPDGTWVHHPEPSAVGIVGKFPSDSPVYPVADLAPKYQIPVWLVQLSEGYDAYLCEREEALAYQHPMLRIVQLNSGQWPQYTAVPELTALLSGIAHDPRSRAVSLYSA